MNAPDGNTMSASSLNLLATFAVDRIPPSIRAVTTTTTTTTLTVVVAQGSVVGFQVPVGSHIRISNTRRLGAIVNAAN